MSEDKKFNHIKINDIDDDIVIQAGIKDDPAQMSYQAEEAIIASSDERDDLEGSEEDSIDKTALLKNAKTSPDRDGYQPTTLDDIDSSKMSTTQKVIVILALLAIAAFVVYSIFFT